MGSNDATDRIYQFVIDQILSGTYPEHSKISERLIGEHFGLSRTVVREAFSRLKKNGWLYAAHKSGTYVAPIDYQKIKANYEARLYLEPQVLMMAYPNLTSEDIQEMKDLCEIMATGDDMEYTSAETALHRTISEKTRNPYVIKFIAEMIEVMLRAASTNTLRGSHRTESLEDWRMIVEHLEKKSPHMAAQLLERHMLNSYRFFCQTVLPE